MDDERDSTKFQFTLVRLLIVVVLVAAFLGLARWFALSLREWSLFVCLAVISGAVVISALAGLALTGFVAVDWIFSF